MDELGKFNETSLSGKNESVTDSFWYSHLNMIQSTKWYSHLNMFKVLHYY